MSNQHKDQTEFIIRPYHLKRLEEYKRRMSQDNLKVVFDDNVADVLRAQGFSCQESPRSVYKVEKLYEALSGYAPNKIPPPKPDFSVNSGIALARVCFARKGDDSVLHVMPMTPETLVAITSHPEGSAGLTNYGCSKQESQTRALERGLQTLKKIKQPEPCLAFARTQFNDKTRLVWGYPYSMTFIEGLIAQPLIQLFKGGNTPMAFAMTTMELGTKLRIAAYHKRWAYSLDMSQFDATISSSLIHTAFSILRSWYDQDECEPVSGVTVKRIFDIVERYFIHTTIVMPDGKLYIGKDHGVPSGSYFTQMIDSIVNVIIGGTIADHFHLNVSKKELFVLGDDLLMWSNRKMDLDKIASYANSVFSVKLHGSEKSEIFRFDEPIKYLGRIWTNGLPDLDEEEILKRMMYPERFRKYDPQCGTIEKQVRRLLLSYASVYQHGWRIAAKALSADRAHYGNGCANTDVNTYCNGFSEWKRTDPNHLSGLTRYRMMYLFTPDVKGDIPITATQYWL